jgi:hypothetical protein
VAIHSRVQDTRRLEVADTPLRVGIQPKDTASLHLEGTLEGHLLDPDTLGSSPLHNNSPISHHHSNSRRTPLATLVLAIALLLLRNLLIPLQLKLWPGCQSLRRSLR